LKRGPKPTTTSRRPNLIKKTFLFEENIHQHLAVAALVVGKEQADIVREAVQDRLTKMGCDLSKPPELPALKDVSS
jgi:hypothetical protein